MTSHVWVLQSREDPSQLLTHLDGEDAGKIVAFDTEEEAEAFNLVRCLDLVPVLKEIE